MRSKVTKTVSKNQPLMSKVTKTVSKNQLLRSKVTKTVSKKQLLRNNAAARQSTQLREPSKHGAYNVLRNHKAY